jgi:hypothetical protein
MVESRYGNLQGGGGSGQARDDGNAVPASGCSVGARE